MCSFRQLCKGMNSAYLVYDTYHFQFASALTGHDTYSWSRIRGEPTFKISIHAIDWDPVGGNDDLGVTSYTYKPNAPLEQTVTTSPGSMNLRIRLHYIVTPPPTPKPTTTTTKRVVTTPVKTTTSTTSTTTTAATTTNTKTYHDHDKKKSCHHTRQNNHINNINYINHINHHQHQNLPRPRQKGELSPHPSKQPHPQLQPHQPPPLLPPPLYQHSPEIRAAQSLSIAVPVYQFNNITSELVTKILLTYRCTICDLEVDQVKDSVEAALQTMNLKQYQETNTGEYQVKTSKRYVGLIVGVVISVLFVIAIACAILWWYKRKLQHRSKISTEGRRNTETENRKPSDA
uniref:Uncharacterized protein LOC111120419 n=1 Tax=Crassostrea virginica TaxID=6565 RepID=A0A8B8CQY9_CRAVI|nr:uncharacterized protein LOC111120419 [Crassostrea virginica]